MTDKFQNKYRIPSTRAQWWNYGNAAAYFITICTHNREHYFGKIENGIMILNDIGKTAHEEWLKTPELRPDMNLILGEFVVMPNHFHAIIIIGENQYNGGGGRVGDGDGDGVGDGDGDGDGVGDGDGDGVGDGDGDGDGRDAMHRVSTGITTGITAGTANKFAPQSKNLASIVRGFKSSVTTQAKKSGHENFAWQTRFHDHIIRDQKSFDMISNYIADNPKKWTNDTFYN